MIPNQKTTEVVRKNEEIVTSDKLQFTKEDFVAMAQNAFKYSAPVLLVALVALQAGKTWKEIVWMVYAVLIQNAINFVTKYLGEHNYVVEK